MAYASDHAGWANLARLMAHTSRLEQAKKLTQARAGSSAGRSQRQVAEELGVARTTLQDWQARPAPSDAPAALVAFCASPEGVQWLQRVVFAAHLAITLLAEAGVRVVCQFLELSGLAAFVAPSYGTQQGLNVALEEAWSMPGVNVQRWPWACRRAR